MHKKNTVFIVLIMQSMIILSPADVEYNKNRAFWTVKTSQIHITIQSCSFGTKIQSLKGNLCRHNDERYYDTICVSGVPTTMNSVPMDENRTAIIWLTGIQRYHTLLISKNDPESVEYFDISTLNPQSKDSKIIQKIKELIQSKQYLER